MNLFFVPLSIRSVLFLPPLRFVIPPLRDQPSPHPKRLVLFFCLTFPFFFFYKRFWYLAFFFFGGCYFSSMKVSTFLFPQKLSLFSHSSVETSSFSSRFFDEGAKELKHLFLSFLSHLFSFPQLILPQEAPIPQQSRRSRSKDFPLLRVFPLLVFLFPRLDNSYPLARDVTFFVFLWFPFFFFPTLNSVKSPPPLECQQSCADLSTPDCEGSCRRLFMIRLYGWSFPP